ncbi:MAG: hypothetical protein ACTSQI_21630 [Candidatus Helarchaeota archaeon]
MIALILIIYFLIIKAPKKRIRSTFEINEAEIGIGSQRIKIKPNYDDIQIAYKLWVEMSTRKIGIEIDLKNDVIIEIYNSWYDFFKITRELIKDIPANKVRKNKSTKALVDLSIEVLNKGLRPHLTSWQARFRKWYDHEMKRDENIKLSPQEIQQKYPEYENLIKEMDKINIHLINYRNSLEELLMVK